MTQDELAEKMEVSRQSVSKWEGAQSVPDLNRILKMSEIFGVSTDYLLKDEVTETGEPSADIDTDSPLRRVSMEEASAFLKANDSTAGKTAAGVSLCILSPVTLIMLAAASETKGFPLNENAAAGIGLVTLILMIAVAVLIFITQDNKLKPYEYLEHEDIDTDYGVAGMAREKLTATQSYRSKCTIAGVMLCILSVLPLFSALILDNKISDFAAVSCVGALLAICSAGVFLLTKCSILTEGCNKLLEEGDFTRENKHNSFSFGKVYWCIVVAAFITVSLLTNAWDKTVFIFPGAGVLYVALNEIFKARRK
jgi:DNA-binding XRE family transcriptional regulator